jgi:hypothetical protein
MMHSELISGAVGTPAFCWPAQGAMSGSDKSELESC